MKRIQLVRWGSLLMILMLVVVAAAPAFAQTDPLNDEVAVLPQALERISWGAIIAGAIVALVTQVALNLLSIGVGASRLNPAEYDSDSLEDVGRSTIISMALIMIGSLFLGGWLAARFAGSPERLDGLLHGLIVWGLVTLATLLLLSSAVGSLVSSLGRFLQRGLALAGRTAQTVGTGVAQGVGTVAQGVGNVAQGVGSVAQRAADNVSQAAQDALRTQPDPMGRQMSAVETIQREAFDILNRAGINQQQVADTARDAVQDVRTAASEAAQNPAELERIVANTLGRLFNRGRELVGQVDRDAVVDLLVQRGGMSPEDARATVERWERQVQEIPRQAGQVINDARGQSDSLGGMRDQVGNVQNNVRDQVANVQNNVRDQVANVQNTVREQVATVQATVERTARETAQQATDLIAKLAMAAFVIVLVGAIAASAGGYLGAPQELPVAEVDTSASVP